MIRPILLLLPFLLLLSGCSSLLYYPTQIEYFKKNDLPYRIQDFTFMSTDGSQIHAWYFHSKNPKGKILFFHGNAQNLSAHFGMLSWIVDYNYDLMIFDYPGYGKSTGVPTPESTVLSGVAAINQIETINPNLPLFLYGQSLGGQILQKSINLHNKKNYKAVFIEASFISYRSIARRMAAKSWITWLLQPVAWLVMSDRWAGDPALISPVPIYILHGDQDQVIPIDQGEVVFEKSLEPKKWKVFEDGQHSNTYFIKKGIYRRYLLEALDFELEKK